MANIDSNSEPDRNRHEEMKILTLLVILTTPLIAVAQTTAPRPAPAPIEIVVFSDFQCPFCAHFATGVREVQSKGIEDVPTTIKFKHFPLSIHPAALLVHQAAVAAAEQGKFWEMHDLLFTHQAAVSRENLLLYAKSLKLDLDRFRRDLDSERTGQLIEADRVEGEKLGVQGTPAFFINGLRYSGTRSLDQLRGLVTSEGRRLQTLAEITDTLMSKGPADAPVTLEFFADLESPVTPPALNVLDQMLKKYPKTVRLQFRNFPLSFHPQAALAHEASMIAARYGHFWEFASYIIEHQDALKEQDLIAQAGRLGLDQAGFAESLQQHKYAPRVETDLIAGMKKGLRGSPVVFVNGKRIDGVPSVQLLTEFIQAELTAQMAKQSERR
jgi:protein-disulfide isomerase